MTTDPTQDRVRLRADDAEAITVVSAHLQDAIVPIADMAFLRDEGHFAMVVNRFKWETPPARHRGGKEVFYRTNCGVMFQNVGHVQYKGVDLTARDQMLCLLAVHGDGEAVDLLFCGGGSVRITRRDAVNGDPAAPIIAWVGDIGDPWPTFCRPEHRVETDAARGAAVETDVADEPIRAVS